MRLLSGYAFQAFLCLILPYVAVILAPLAVGTISAFRWLKTLQVGGARPEVAHNVQLRAWTFAVLLAVALIAPLGILTPGWMLVARAGFAILLSGLLAIIVLALSQHSLSPMLRTLTRVKVVIYTFLVLHGALAIDGLMAIVRLSTWGV